MKYDVLYNFISPITGRIIADEDYVLVGDRNGFATSSPALIDLRLDLIHLRQDYNILSSASLIIGFPNTEAPNAQVLSKLSNGFVYNTDGIVSTINITPANADAKYILQTKSENLPNAQALDALSSVINPNGGILKSNSSGVISIASGGATPFFDDYVTPSALAGAVETGVAEAIAAAATAFEAEMLPFIPLPPPFNIGVQIGAAITTAIVAQAGLTTIEISAAIASLRLNNISVNNDVSFYNFKLTNLANPINLTDGVNLQTLIAYVGNVSTSVILVGDVTGIGNTGTPIETTLELTLDEIKIAQNTVNLNNQRIKNLAQSPDEDFDAVSFTFLWDLMHDEVNILWP